MQAAGAVEKAFADAKKSLRINVDGAIGAILADLGMNPAACNGRISRSRGRQDLWRTQSKDKLARDQCAYRSRQPRLRWAGRLDHVRHSFVLKSLFRRKSIDS
jgi:hypothetical protein